MTHRVTIEGYSDDVVVVTNDGITDEIDTDSAVLTLRSEDRQVSVSVEYGRVGVWCFGVAPVDEDTPLLPCRIEHTSRGYASRLVVESDHPIDVLRP